MTIGFQIDGVKSMNLWICKKIWHSQLIQGFRTDKILSKNIFVEYSRKKIRNQIRTRVGCKEFEFHLKF